jgi:hypothetical protein
MVEATPIVHAHLRHLIEAGDVRHARSVDDIGESLVTGACNVEDPLRHTPGGPLCRVIHAFHRFHHKRRWEHLHRAWETVEDVAQLAETVRYIDDRQFTNRIIGTGDHLRNCERSVIRGAEHDEPAFFFPTLRMPQDIRARYQAAHRVGHEIHGSVGSEPAVDLLAQAVGDLGEILSPIVPEGLHVPAVRSEAEELFGIPFL